MHGLQITVVILLCLAAIGIVSMVNANKTVVRILNEENDEAPAARDFDTDVMQAVIIGNTGRGRYPSDHVSYLLAEIEVEAPIIARRWQLEREYPALTPDDDPESLPDR